MKTPMHMSSKYVNGTSPSSNFNKHVVEVTQVASVMKKSAVGQQILPIRRSGPGLSVLLVITPKWSLTELSEPFTPVVPNQVSIPTKSDNGGLHQLESAISNCFMLLKSLKMAEICFESIPQIGLQWLTIGLEDLDENVSRVNQVNIGGTKVSYMRIKLPHNF